VGAGASVTPWQGQSDLPGYDSARRSALTDRDRRKIARGPNPARSLPRSPLDPGDPSLAGRKAASRAFGMGFTDSPLEQMRFKLFVPRRERNESLTGTGTVAEAAKVRLEAVAYLPGTDGSIALLMTRFQQQRGSNRQERCFNQIHIDRLRGSVVQRQTPVIPLGIAGVALVPPTRSRIRPPIPAHEDVLVCAAKTDPICPLPLRSGKRAAVGRPAILSGINRDFADVDFGPVLARDR
jgi:hypothetical protein